MFRGLYSVIYKETIHILRDPRTLFLMLLVPGIQLTIFGYAIELDVKHIGTVVQNLDGRPESMRLIEAFQNSGYFDIEGFAFTDDALMAKVVSGEAKVGIVIPPDYSDKLLLRERTQVQVLIDGSDANVAMQALNVANAITLRTSLAATAGGDEGPPEPLVEARPRVLFNPDMRTERFMVPGLVGIVMQLVTMFLTAFAIVREKENGTLEQLMVTPVSRLGLMAGKLIPYGVVGTIETALVLLIMRFLFDVHISGSVVLLAALSLLFLFTSLGLGLLVSTIATSQVQAIQVAFVIMLPSVLLSGFIFPLEAMPLPIYALGHAIPATYFIQILRGIILRGADLTHLWQEAVILFGFGVALLAISTARFRKTVA